MVRVKRTKCSLKYYMLCAAVFVACAKLAYEIVILCILDKIGHVTQPTNRGHLLDGTDNHEKPYDVARIHADTVLHELSEFLEPNLNELGTHKVINTVHYVWCRNKTFNFINYLSVMSVWKIMRPDIIEFHYQVPPIPDKYDDWFDEIRKTIPCFVAKEIPPNWDGDDKGCGFWFGLAVIDDRGGIFIDENVMITDKLAKYREREMSLLFSKLHAQPNANIAVAMGKDHHPDLRSFIKNFAIKQDTTEGAEFCKVLDQSRNMSDSPCYIIDGPLHPVDIFLMQTTFVSIARKLIYGSEQVKEPKPILPGTIPKIVHYVWFGNKEMDFIMFLSMLSTLFIFNPDHVFIHGDGSLHGKYLDRILTDKRVVLVSREKPFDIFGHTVLYAQHRSDIVRAECLLQYGGVYMDWDVLWLRDPSDLLLSGYDAIANFDHMQQGEFPDTINLGVLMAKPKSVFVKKWQDALINYRSEDFLYNAVELPYKVYEKYPEHIYIERRLQVMCFHLKCHPTFHSSFKNFVEEQPFDWRTDVYSIHFTYPDPEELTSEEACINGTGRFAEIGKFLFKLENRLPK